MTAAAARRSPSSRAQLALKSESTTTPAKMRTSATTNPTRILCQRIMAGHERNGILELQYRRHRSPGGPVRKEAAMALPAVVSSEE